MRKDTRVIAEEISAQFGSEFELDRRDLTLAIDAALRQREQEVLRLERERVAKIINVRIATCDRMIALNDEQGHDWGYGCWRDIGNTLRATLGAVGTICRDDTTREGEQHGK